MNQKKKVYILKTHDKYELPLGVYDSLDDLATAAGKKKSSIASSISHTKNGTKSFCKYERVEIEE